MKMIKLPWSIGCLKTRAMSTGFGFMTLIKLNVEKDIIKLNKWKLSQNMSLYSWMAQSLINSNKMILTFRISN